MANYVTSFNSLFFGMQGILFTIIPYGIILFIGTRLHTFSKNNILILCSISFLIFSAYAVILYTLKGHLLPTQSYKYPPTAYYISYAMFASTFLYWVSQTKIFSLIPGKSFISFLGRSSLWIYLWHIFILYFISWSHISINFYSKFVVVLSVALGVASLQKAMLGKVLSSINSQRTKKFLKTVFSG